MYIKIMDGNKCTGVMEIPSRNKSAIKEAFKQFELVDITKEEYTKLVKENK
jgi:hypothetical protein